MRIGRFRAMVVPADVKDPSTVVHYRLRADSFFSAARDLETLDSEVPDYWPAVGLLAVHGCIALTDALLVAAEGSRSSSEDHGTAARDLKKWCTSTETPHGGLKHFEWLLKKNHFSYGERTVRPEELKLAKVKMDQFYAWAFSTFPEVAQLQGGEEIDARAH